MTKCKAANRAVRIGSVLVAGLFATGVHAADGGPRYTFGELAYADVQIDDDGFFGSDPEGDGFLLTGSVAVADMVHLIADYADADLELDGFGLDVGYTQYSLGAGLNFAVAKTVDLVARLAYVNVEVDVDDFGSQDENGYGLSAGSRAMLTEKFEINGFLNYVDLGDDLDDTSVDLGAVYNFTPLVAVSGGVGFGDDSRSFNLGVRLYFGDR